MDKVFLQGCDTLVRQLVGWCLSVGLGLDNTCSFRAQYPVGAQQCLQCSNCCAALHLGRESGVAV